MLPAAMMAAHVFAVIFDGVALFLTWLQMKWALGASSQHSKSSGLNAVPMILMRDSTWSIYSSCTNTDLICCVR